MIIDCISDLHGYYPKLEGGDLLIIGGDLTARDTSIQHSDFKLWLYKQKYRKKIVIAGNHDAAFLGLQPDEYIFSSYNINTVAQISYADYLLDSSVEFEGLKIWGSPWTPEFLNWHFMKKRGEELREVWDKIPLDTDILVTHGPPYDILDQVTLSSRGDKFKHAGCEELLKAVMRVKPKLHVFGHIHGEGGKQMTIGRTTFVNAAIMDEDYNPVNKPVRIILEERVDHQEEESERG